MRARALLGFVLTAVLTLVACSERSPTTPGGGTSMQIVSITPESPIRSTAPQTLLVQGRNFLTQPILFVKEPDGTERVVTGTDIQDRQISSFQATLVLSQAGAHELRVGPSAGAQSAPFALVVRATQTSPIVIGVTPTSVVRSAAVQVVTLDGMNFDPNLTVTITEPDGVTIVLSASQLTSVTATSVQFGKVFTKAGIYNFVVAIPSGEISNPVQINAV